MRLVRVALDVPLHNLFDYRFDAATDDLIGARVLVPFGRGQRAGIILEVGTEPEVELPRIKPVSQLLDEPKMADDVLALVRFASRYYHCPLGQMVMAALPQGLRRAHVKIAKELSVALTSSAAAGDWSALPARAIVKRRILAQLQTHGPTTTTVLRALSPTAGRALKELEADGWIAMSRAGTRPLHDASAALEVASAPTLTDDQRKAIQTISAAPSGFISWLLLGVTGSGKTEVYLQLIERVLADGGQVLLLVPEINLTPQLEARLSVRFPHTELVSLHSDVPEAERLRRWRAAESAAARIVVGTRLAVFTPLPKLALIIVDEEHDASFKQQEGLRYSGRDLAVMRAKHRDVPIVLGSATPSLESYAKALGERYRTVELPVRANAAPPVVRCINTREERLREGLSQQLVDALGERLAKHEQSLVFINRRGYAPALMCFACAWTAECTRCSARLVLHLKERRLRCHYCGHEEPIAAACPSCGNQDLMPAGHGTQRIEHAIAELFPAARILRIDRDTTRRRDAFVDLQSRMREHDVDILVGTQMLAKGHDFPRLTLVGVINADSSLYSTDFRASEKLFAQLMQVGGRAGRGSLAGEVLIQTEFPDHPVYRAVQAQDYAAFAQSALTERRDAGFPPYAHQALLRAEANERAHVDTFLQRAAAVARTIEAEAVDVYEPVPATVAKVAGRERAHLLVQSGSRGELQRFLDVWRLELATAENKRVRWSLDVDPLDL